MHYSSPRPFVSILPNFKGQDYFVGDIHGEYEKLNKALDEIRFDPSVDRLFCTGDLVDRGDDSEYVIEWMQQPFLFATRGNHENMFLKWWELRNSPEHQHLYERDFYFLNGGKWVKNVSQVDLARIAHNFNQMPYFMSVSDSKGRTIGVVHAELPDQSKWPKFIDEELDEERRKIMTCSRIRIKQAHNFLKPHEIPVTDHNQIHGLDVLVCGHTYVKTPTFLGNILYLDTGPWLKKGKEGRFSVLSFNEILRLKTLKD